MRTMVEIALKKKGDASFRVVRTRDDVRLEEVRERHRKWKKEGRIPENLPIPELRDILRVDEELVDGKIKSMRKESKIKRKRRR